MNPKVSIIIPAYNIERYIDECIQSIANQDYENLEIIIVNDGSRDNTAQVVTRYAEKDNRIKLITQQNSGVSVARNTGLDASNGEYIAFIDGDDWIDPDYIACLISNAVATNADIVKGGFRFVEEKSSNFRVSHTSDKSRVLNTDEAIDAFLLGEMSVTVCGGIFKRSLLVNNNLRFQQGIKIGEDGQYMMKALCVSKVVTLIPEADYNVRVRIGSASRNKPNSPNKDLAKDFIFEVLKPSGKLDVHKESYEIYRLRSVCSEIIKGSILESKKEFLERYNLIYPAVAEFNTLSRRKRLPYKFNMVALLCKYPNILYKISNLPCISKYISLR